MSILCCLSQRYSFIYIFYINICFFLQQYLDYYLVFIPYCLLQRHLSIKSFILISIPFSSNILTTVLCPFPVVYHSGICQFLFFVLISASFSSNALTTASCPFPAACYSGVRPFLSFISTSTPLCNNALAINERPCTAT